MAERNVEKGGGAAAVSPAGGRGNDGSVLSGTIDAEVSRTERDNIRQLHAQRRVRIIIPSGRSEHERAPVTVGVNGREFLIVRDVEVEVPEAVLNVLALAREKIPVSAGGDGKLAVTWEEAPRIPYQVLGYAEVESAAGD